MLDYRLYARDASFDLLDDALPEALSFRFGDQLARARTLLKQRNRVEVASLLNMLDSTLKAGGALLFDAARAATPTAGDEYFISRSKALRLAADKLPVPVVEGLPPVTCAEICATFALACVGEASRLARSTDTPLPELEELAAEAMEAVVYAEALEAAAKAAANAAQRAGRARSAKFEPLKAELRARYWAKHSHRSNRNAATRLAQELPRELQAALTTDDPVKAYEKWIAQFRKAREKESKA